MMRIVILFLALIAFSGSCYSAETKSSKGSLAQIDFDYSLYTSRDYVFPPSNFTFLTQPTNESLIPGGDFDVIAELSNYYIDFVPTNLDTRDADYFKYLTRCCFESCCFDQNRKGFEGIDDGYMCGDFEDYFCCCCSCCCCEEDYYGEGVGAGGTVATGTGFGTGGIAGFGAGGSAGTNGDATDVADTTTTGTTTDFITETGPSMIIPEPSIYLILATALIIAVYVSKRKYNKANTNRKDK